MLSTGCGEECSCIQNDAKKNCNSRNAEKETPFRSEVGAGRCVVGSLGAMK